MVCFIAFSSRSGNRLASLASSSFFVTGCLAVPACKNSMMLAMIPGLPSAPAFFGNAFFAAGLALPFGFASAVASGFAAAVFRWR